MINKNFMSGLKHSLFYSNGNYAKFKHPNGEEFSWGLNFSGQFAGNNLTNTDYSAEMSGVMLLLGTGDTASTIDDYKLDNIWTDYTVITQVCSNMNTTYDNNAFLISRSIQNTSSESVTVKEQAICLNQKYDGNIMIAREVLPEPVTLQPGEKHTFTMTISLE